MREKCPRSYFWSVFSCIRIEYGVISGPYVPVFNPNTGEYGVISGPYISVFSSNAGKYGPEVTP